MMAKKRILSWLVAASLALSLLPAAALAADETEPAAPATPGSAFTDVVNKIDSTFTDPNETAASNLTNGVYDALNGTKDSTGKTTNDIYAKDENNQNVVKGEVLEQVDGANTAANTLENGLNNVKDGISVPDFEVVEAPKLDEDGNPVLNEDGTAVTEPVTQEKGDPKPVEDFDQFMKDKADAAINAAGDGNKLVGEANDLIQDLNELVQAGKVETVQGIADKVAEKAEAANAAYEEAAIAHAEAEYALNAAKENYNNVISTALENADPAALEKALEEKGKSLDTLSDEEKAELAIQLANADLDAAQTALETAKGKLEALKETRNAAETAKVIAEKYQAIADKMKDRELTADQFIAILLDADGWTAGENGPLGKLDKTNFDNGGLTDTAVDYALADKDLQKKQAELKRLQNVKDEDVRRDGAIKEMQDTYNTQVDLSGIKTTDDLYAAIDTAIENLSKGNSLRPVLQGRIKAMKDHLGTIKSLENKESLSSDEAKRLSEAKKALFQEWSDPADIAHTDRRSLVKRIAEFPAVGDEQTIAHDLMEVLDHMVFNQGTINKSQAAHNALVSQAQTAVRTAQNTLDNIGLKAALDAYLATVGAKDGADAAATANKAAQLAAVLKAISDKAVEDAQGKAAAAAAAAQEAADKLDAAQEAYDKALEKLNNTVIRDNNLNGETLKNLLKNAEAQLAEAKDALEKAKDNKDAADEIKKNADQAVEDAQERRDEINDELNNIITGGTDTGDDDTTIEDGIVPLAGLIDRQTLVSYLYTHEGSPDGVDAEGEYTLALAWAVANDIVDEEDDPEELVTVAILRDVMTRYAKLLNRTFDVEIPGEDDDIVMNCDEILAEFFGD